MKTLRTPLLLSLFALVGFAAKAQQAPVPPVPPTPAFMTVQVSADVRESIRTAYLVAAEYRGSWTLNTDYVFVKGTNGYAFDLLPIDENNRDVRVVGFRQDTQHNRLMVLLLLPDGTPAVTFVASELDLPGLLTQSNSWEL